MPRISVEQGLYAATALLAVMLRLWDLGSRAMHGDEAVHAWLAWNLFTGVGYQYDPVYHGPFQFPLTALSFFLFGVSNFSGRLLAALFGTALVITPYFFRREMGRAAALLAAVYIAVSPAYVYVSRLERDDIFTAFFAMTLAIAIWGYARTRGTRFVYLGAASAALSLAAMENTYITLFVFGSFILIVLASEALARTSAGNRLRSFWRRTGSAHTVSWMAVSLSLVLLAAAFALTVATGAYLPVPLVLAVLLIAYTSREAVLDAVRPEWTDALRSIRLQTWLNALTIIVAILFLFYSTFGSNLHGIWDSGKPILNSGSACPGNTFPLNPCRKDLVGGLFYWLSQHKVARGGQPWFYYTLLYGLYEQMAVIFGLAGLVWFARRATLFTAFLTYWALLMFGVYSWAGEKFPWLMIHPLMPFALLASMFVVDVLRTLSPWKWLVVALLALVAVTELHNMYELNFVNGANPVEMMVYVQSSPDTPKVAANILSLSNKVTNGNDMQVAIDSLDTWPFAWYLRDMSNVAYPVYPENLQKPYTKYPAIIVDASHQPALAPKLRGYVGHQYKLRWWFPEDYKTLTWASAAHDAVNPGYWKVIAQWFVERRLFGPRQSVDFFYYVKRGLVGPY